MSRTHRDRAQVFAVIRFDPDISAIEDQITVTEIVSEQSIAEAEVARLNELNAAKGCRYFWQPTRLYPAGTSASARQASSRPAI